MKIFFLNLFTLVLLFSSEFNDAVKYYEEGSYSKAFRIFGILATEGDKKAQYNVALMYENGLGTKINKEEAILWYIKASKQGQVKAQFNVARYYHKNIEKDNHAIKKAKYWYEKAMKQNLPEAYNNLAILYLEEYPNDKSKAVELLEKSIELNNSVAGLNMGLLYAWGEGIEHNKLKAYEYFTKALRSGHNDASAALDKLCKESAWVCKN